jgi:hypothetical protein
MRRAAGLIVPSPRRGRDVVIAPRELTHTVRILPVRLETKRVLCSPLSPSSGHRSTQPGAQLVHRLLYAGLSRSSMPYAGHSLRVIFALRLTHIHPYVS